MGEVIDHKLLLEATGCENLRARLRGEGDSADYMRMLKSVEAFASMGVPDFAVTERKSACAGGERAKESERTLRSLQMP